MPLKDIGGGIQMIDVSKEGTSELDQATKTLGLVELAQRLQQGPIDAQNKRLEGELKKNQVMMLDITNEKSRVDLLSAKNDEFRKQTDHIAKGIQSLPEIMLTAPELGMAYAKRLGLPMVKNEAGQYVAAISNKDGSISSYKIDPEVITKPEKRIEITDNWRKNWQDQTKDYQIVSVSYRDMQKLAELKTAQGDIGIIFRSMKINDPPSSVREGEAATAQNAPGVPDRIRVMYNEALKTNGAYFSDPARKAFIEAAKVSYDNRRQDAIAVGQGLGRMALGQRLNPEDVVSPVGDLTWKDINGGDPAFQKTNQKTGLPPNSGASPVQTKTSNAQEASVIPSGQGAQQPAPAPVVAPDQELDELTFGAVQGGPVPQRAPIDPIASKAKPSPQTPTYNAFERIGGGITSFLGLDPTKAPPPNKNLPPPKRAPKKKR